LDWTGDHPHTNFRTLLAQLQGAGYAVELAARPLHCIDLARYGALLLADTEADFYPEEIAAVTRVRAPRRAPRGG
jgi:hypothetical protein